MAPKNVPDTTMVTNRIPPNTFSMGNRILTSVKLTGRCHIDRILSTKFLRRAFIGLLVVSRALLAVDPQERQVVDFISRFPVIRIYVAQAPELGSQSASIGVLKRIRSLGYHGKIELIYDDATKSKLPVLLNRFDEHGPDRQQIDGQLEAVSLSRFKASNPSEVGLSLCGADDIFEDSPEKAQARVGELKTRMYLQLNHRQWSTAWGSHLYFRPPGSTEVLHTYLDDLEDMYIKEKLPLVKNIEAFVDEQLSGQFSAKRETVQAFLRDTVGVQKNWELAPVYGLTPGGGNYVHALSHYIQGLRIAFREHPDEFRRNGIVVPVFNDLKPGQIAQLKRDIEKLNNELKSTPPIELESLTNFSKAKNIPAIRIVLVGRVPRDLFDYIFTTSTIPPLAEGKQTVNLMHLDAKPYLNSSRFEKLPSYDRGSKQMANASFVISDFFPSPDDLHLVAQFIRDARKPDSDVAHHFHALAKTADSIANDKVVQGLRMAAEAYQSPDPQATMLSFDRLGPNRYCDWETEALEPELVGVSD